MQAFNTGYTHKANTRVVMDCNVTQNTQRSWEALFGGRLGDFRSHAFCFFSRNQNGLSSPVDKPCYNRSGYETNSTGFVYGERIILTCEGRTATWVRYSAPNTQVGSVTTAGTADDGKTPMFFFDLNTSGTEGGLQMDNSKSVMTLYGSKIYEDETLVCDFVPAKYNNEVGLYDRVRHTFSGSLTDTPFFAPDLAGYERALAAIQDGRNYRVFTMVGSKKYYLTADGYLTVNRANAPLFQFVKVAGEEYEYGFHLKNGNTCFTNPRTYSVGALTEGHLNTAERESPRPNWEAQVFFLNEQGKYAVRSTNAQSGDTQWSWIGCAYWTVNDGPKAEYSFDMNYIWQLEDERPIFTEVPEEDVTLIEAIRSTGQQAFNTGYIHKANTRVEMDCNVSTDTQYNYEALFGARYQDYMHNAFCFFIRHWRSFGYSYDRPVNHPMFSRSGDEREANKFLFNERVKVVGEGLTAKWYRNSDLNTVAGSVTANGTADDGKTPMFFFDLNTSGTEGGLQMDNSKSVMTLYGCKIYEDETLVCDFVPAVYYGEAGLYDRVNHTFSGSLTSTPFEIVPLSSQQYPVWVGETQVDIFNCDDVLGDGLVSYTPGEGSGTLTFAGNPTISGYHQNALVSADGIDLTVNVANGLSLSSTDRPYGIYMTGGGKTLTLNIPNSTLTISTLANAIYTQGDLVITGKNLTVNKGVIVSLGNITVNLTGKLYAPSTEGGGVFLSSQGNITIDGSIDLKLGISAPQGNISLNGGELKIDAKYGQCVGGNNISIAGNFTGTSQSSGASIIYAKGNLTINGNISATSTGTGTPFWVSGDIIIPDDYAFSAPARGRVQYDSEANANVIVDDNGNRATSVKIIQRPEPSVLTSETGELTLQDCGVVSGTGGSDTHIVIADGATVTLKSVNINSQSTVTETQEWAGITCLGDATIILEGMNFAYGGPSCPGVYVPQNKTLTIMGSGTLVATGAANAAGIGGGLYGHACANAGNIVINSGNVIAKGGGGAAGIGSGRNDDTSGQTVSCGNITITGGAVAAEGGEYGTGIGTGHGRKPVSVARSICGDITISGGTVDATGGYEGAAIGSAKYGKCGNITITEGIKSVKVNGHSMSYQVIGKTDNNHSLCGTITIGTATGANIRSNCTLYAINATNFPDDSFRNFLFTQDSGQDHILTSQEKEALTELDASGQGIASFGGIDFFPSLTTLKVYANRCKGDDMQQLISQLPTVTEGQLFAIDSNNLDERNIITEAQVSAANAKGWTVYDNSNPTVAYTGAAFTIPAGATDLSTKSGIYVAQHGEVLSGLGGSDLQLQIADGATVTLNDADITLAAANAENHWAGITCLGNATLVLEGLNVVDGCTDYPAIYVPEGKDLVIKGEGTLSAQGGNNAAGIGGGKSLGCGNISLEGGIISSAGGINAAAIGSGQSGSCGTIGISSGVYLVTATVADNNSQCIGKGREGSCGEITLAADLKSESSDDNLTVSYWTAIPVTANTRVLKGSLTYKVESNVTLGGRLRVERTPTLILGEGTTLTAPKGIQVSDGKSLTVEGCGALVASAEGDDAAIGGDLREGCGTIIINGGQITVNDGGFTGMGYGFRGRENSALLIFGWTNPSDFLLISSCNIYSGLIRFAEGKSFYIDGTTTEATTSDIAGHKLVPATSKFITESTTVLGDGCTYYVNANVTNNNRIKVVGSAVLHLNEGYKLTATKGFRVEGENTLTIEGDGSLEATADKYDAAIGGGGSRGFEMEKTEYGHIIINGGYISATGGEEAAGIGGGVINHNRQHNSTITINGGYINALGGKNGAAIGGGFNHWFTEPGNEDIGTPGVITINGGQVTAVGGEDGYNEGYRCSGIGCGSQGAVDGQLTLGWTNPADYILATSYGISNIAFAEGKRFIVEGTNEEITLENFAAAKWKKLLPIVALDPIPVTSETTTLEGNLTYVVDSDVTLSHRLRVRGTPTLLLNEGKTLTAPMGIQVAIIPTVTAPVMLTIEGSGALTASADNGDAAIGGDVGQACSIIRINGGQITATGSGNSVGAGAGQGGDTSGEIQVQWTNPTDFVFINTVGCNYTHLVDGKPFLVDDTGEVANNSHIAGNKLVPYSQCATPTITYSNGKLLFGCETEGVEFVSHFSTPGDGSGKGSEVSVPTAYTVTVYAKKARHIDSETVTKDIDIRYLPGDGNGDGKFTITDVMNIIRGNQ